VKADLTPPTTAWPRGLPRDRESPAARAGRRERQSAAVTGARQHGTVTLGAGGARPAVHGDAGGNIQCGDGAVSVTCRQCHTVTFPIATKPWPPDRATITAHPTTHRQTATLTGIRGRHAGRRA